MMSFRVAPIRLSVVIYLPFQTGLLIFCRQNLSVADYMSYRKTDRQIGLSSTLIWARIHAGSSSMLCDAVGTLDSRLSFASNDEQTYVLSNSDSTWRNNHGSITWNIPTNLWSDTKDYDVNADISIRSNSPCTWITSKCSFLCLDCLAQVHVLQGTPSNI